MEIDAILWDFDGTIANSNEKNVNVTKEVMRQTIPNFNEQKLPISLQSAEEYQKAFHSAKNWKEFYKKDFKLTDDEINAAGKLWSNAFANDKTKIKLYDGINQVINSLGDFPQGICSQNCHYAINEFLENQNLVTFFHSIIGYAHVTFAEQKPHPASFIKCINELNINDYKLFVYIGDHPHDICFAKNAEKYLRQTYQKNINVITIGVNYHNNNISDWYMQPDFCANSAKDIYAFIATILKTSKEEFPNFAKKEFA